MISLVPCVVDCGSMFLSGVRACVMLSGVFVRWWTGVTGDDWRGRQGVSYFPGALRCCLWKSVFPLWRACVRDAEWCFRSVVDWRDW